MTNFPEEILRRVVEGAKREDYPEKLEAKRKMEIEAKAKEVAHSIFMEFSGALAGKVPFELVLKHALPILESKDMDQKEQFYFAYMVLSELEKLRKLRVN